ncbi:MAG: MerR family transcriptional regulator [Armatimonadetes bacterium]|nr:MerR family transcriptional regulator [Armatimonadota bacterium]
MYKIGDFSRLCQVSVKTLHHYDDVGLVRPTWVDRENGYRFYAAEQVTRVRRILNLKALGFSLEQIAVVLDGNPTSMQLHDLLQEKQRELRQLARDTHDRLAQLDIWLTRITEEETMPRLDVVVKTIGPQLVASMRERITSMDRLGEMFAELDAHIKCHGGKTAGPGTFIHHDSEYQDGGSDIETVFPICAAIPATDRIRVYELPGATAMACLIYQGEHNAACDEARQALATWIEEHGYRISGPDRLAFLDCGEAGGKGGSVVEFQYPVEQVA